MGAILTLGLAVLKAGDHVVVSRNVFGSTISLFNNVFGRFGVDATYVDLADLDQWHDAMRPETRLGWCSKALRIRSGRWWISSRSPRSPTNAGRASRWTMSFALRSSSDRSTSALTWWCTPPRSIFDGQGRCVGGAIVTNDDSIGNEAYKVMRTAGPSMSPFNAWVFLKGLETLRLRMQAHCASAMKVARWLESHPAVERVHYLGLERHPQHRLARRQQKGFGGIVSFEIRGGREEAWRVLDHTRWLSITANLGDAKTTITHPASTTHSRITAEERAAAGVTEALIRVGVGLEDSEDIKADLGRGLDALSGVTRLRCLAGG